MAFHTICVVFLYLLLIIVCVVGGLSMLFGINLYRYRTKYGHLPSPPRESFLFGHLTMINKAMDKTGLPTCAFLYQWAREYGSVFCVRIIYKPIIICTRSNMVKEILLDSVHLKPPFLYDLFHSPYGERFMGHGLISATDHGKWRSMRKLFDPAFKRRCLISMMDRFNESTNALCTRLMKKADGITKVVMHEELNITSLDVIAKILFNLDVVGSLTRCEHNPFPEAVGTAFRGLTKLFLSPWSLFDPRSEARRFRQEVRQACRFVRHVGRECLTHRIAAIQRGEKLPRDILSCIVEAADDIHNDFGSDLEVMVDEFVTFFAAGQETTSNLIAFALIQLGRHPAAAQRLQAEVDSVMGQTEFVHYHDLAKLEYMSCLLKETMRLSPPVSATSRITAHDTFCEGYRIPAGSWVMLSTYILSRMNEYFDDPLLFNPDRFAACAPERELSRHLYAYFPFSMGQRSCIGQQFALIEAKVILVRILQRFNFQLDQAQSFAFRDDVTNKPVGGCTGYITLRV